MDKITLAASVRNALASAVRDSGNVPAVVYGHHHAAQSISVAYQEFRKAYAVAGKSTVIDLSIDGKKVPVLVHEVQIHPSTRLFVHIDFHAVSMKERVHTSVPVHFVGESDAVKLMGGTLVHARESIEIKALPADLPHAIEADLKKLVDFHSSITIADLEIPKGVEVLDALETVIATVTAPRTADVEAVPATEIAVAAEKTAA